MQEQLKTIPSEGRIRTGQDWIIKYHSNSEVIERATSVGLDKVDLEQLAQYYEIIVYSDKESMYVDLIVVTLDANHIKRNRLSRAATRYHDGKHYRACAFVKPFIRYYVAR
ncbi:mitochondrial import inner membrane translocase subunit TIM50-like protein [Tanacetum coccineum]